MLSRIPATNWIMVCLLRVNLAQKTNGISRYRKGSFQSNNRFRSITPAVFRLVWWLIFQLRVMAKMIIKSNRKIRFI